MKQIFILKKMAEEWFPQFLLEGVQLLKLRFIGIIILILAYVFEYGATLQEDIDLTV